MAKKKKGIQTPKWITEGYDSPEEYEKAQGSSSEDKEKKSNKKGNQKSKTFRVRECPKCKGDDVAVVIGQDTKDEWECKSCGWKGKNILSKELSEEEFMKYLDDKGEEVA